MLPSVSTQAKKKLQKKNDARPWQEANNKQLWKTK